MNFVNVFRQVERMQGEEEHPWRWFLLILAGDLVWCLLTGLLFEVQAPILMAGFHFCLIWISGLVGFYRNRWFFGRDYGLSRKQSLIGVLCICPVAPMTVLISKGILDCLGWFLAGTVFCLLSYGMAAALGEKSRSALNVG